jgi:hypothetical protein
MRIARYYTGKNAGLWLVHTWTAVFLEHLANTSFMALIQAKTKPPSGLPLHVYFMLPRLIRYLAVRVSHLPLHCYLGGFSLMYKQTTKQRYTTHMDTHIHHIGITILLFFFLRTFLPPSLAGRLVQTLPVRYRYSPPITYTKDGD